MTARARLGLRRAVAALLAVFWLAACSEEDRRAWVSILPLPADDAADSTAVAQAGGGVRLSADSTAVLRGADTLFALDDLPGRAPDGSRLAPAAFESVSLAPDSLFVAFTTTGAIESVGIWSRTRQVADIAAAFSGGSAAPPTWSPGGRFLAFSGRGTDGVTRTGMYDLQAGRAQRHPVAAWLARQNRSVTPQAWMDTNRLRVLVAAGAAAEGGIAHVWDAAGGGFIVEAQQEPLAAGAPAGGKLQPGGVFSVDLAGDGAPESVALYRAASGAPSALVLETRGTSARVTATDPLVPFETLGLTGWKDAAQGAQLYQIAELGGRTTLLLTLPSIEVLLAIGLFQVGADGRLTVLSVATPAGLVPGIFYEGTSRVGANRLGLADLDGDGPLEVISAVGRLDPLTNELGWEAVVYRVAGGRLQPAPELDGAALETIAELTRGA
ncbi:MAG: hypothetical protein ABR559_04225 [Gemmatimonadota bacterium]